MSIKTVYESGFTYSPTDDQNPVVPAIVDVLQGESQMANPATDVVWDSEMGAAKFFMDFEHPTQTGTTIAGRTEHTTRYSHVMEAEDSWDSSSYYLPASYADDPEEEVIYQWHTGSIGGSPNFSIRLRGGRFVVYLWIASGFTNQMAFDIGPAIRDVWHHFLVKLKMHPTDGELTVWKDGRLAKCHNPVTGEEWIVPISPPGGGVTNDYTAYPELGSIQQTANGVSLLVWNGKTARGTYPNPTKYPKWGFYKSIWGSRYNSDLSIKPEAYNPSDPLYVEPENRQKTIFIKNVKFETRLNEFSHNEIYKSLDVDGNGPLETPNWWIPDLPPDPEPVPLPEFIKHPIALPNQYYLLPANAVSGDHLGEVNYLYTFCKFWNEYEGTNLTEDQFTFTKVVGPNNFIVDSETGMISVNNLVGISEDTEITVRVAIGGMHVDVTCHIIYIPTVDCIFFDPTYTGDNGTSNGTKERPYLKYEIATHNYGTAGKSYFFKRGTTIQDQECVLVNPVVGGQYPEHINVGAYGQGNRPIFTDTGSGLRSFTIGNQPWGNSAPQPENAGNNIRIFDIEASRTVASSWYPILIKPVGDNIHINRFRGFNTLFENGLLYAAAMTNDVQGTRYRNILLENFEVGNGVDRVVKIETSGVRCFNFRCTNEGSFAGFPAPTCAHKPHVSFIFIDVEVENTSAGSLGFQARASNVVHKWIYAKGLRNVIVPFIHNANDGWGGDYVINDTCIFENIIVDNCYRVGYFGRHSGTTDVVEGLQVNKIKVKSSELGFEIAEGAKNVKVVYSDLSNCTAGAGYRIWSTGGIGAKLHNCTLFNNLNRDIYLQRNDVEIINCNYGLITNPSNATITTSSTSTNPDDLIGLGTDLGYSYDLEGNEVPELPTIGAYELSVVPVEYTVTVIAGTGGSVSGGGSYTDDDEATLTATPDTGWNFVRWSNNVTDNPYTFTVTGDVTLQAIFAQDEPVPGVIIVKGKFRIV